MGILLEEMESSEAELHFSPGVILAIFLGITLISAVFFGLGYSFGRTGNTAQLQHSLLNFGQSAPATTVAATSSPAPSTVQEPSAITPAAPIAVAAQTQPINTQPAVTPTSLATAPEAPSITPAAPAVALPAEPAKHSASHSRYMVQIAAIASHKDAKTLASALQRNGLHAQIRNGAHDRFFHVQIGPFDTQQEAQAMRHKVIAAGYRAILKPA